MTNLPPFSGDDPLCEKCLHSGASTRYLRIGRCLHGTPGVLYVGDELNERLHRECRRCGFEWDERIYP